MLFFYSSLAANTANHRSAKKRESGGVAAKNRPGSSAGVAGLTESHQARRALLLIVCQDDARIICGPRSRSPPLLHPISITVSHWHPQGRVRGAVMVMETWDVTATQGKRDMVLAGGIKS